jgi:GNAT superfamily N-acetyltransferase
MFGPVQPLIASDIPGCLALARDRGWPPEERTWRLLFDLGAVFGVRDRSGDLAGVVALTRYGGELAVIGMLLVCQRYGGRGLGRALVTHALAEAGDAAVFLYSAPGGRALYERLGFAPVGANHTRAGRFVPAAPAGDLARSRPAGDRARSRPAGDRARSRPAGPGDLMAIRGLDGRANGTDRAHLVRRLPGFTSQLRVVERLGVVTGYAGAHAGIGHVSIGPVIAENVHDAKTLISDLAGAVAGPVRVDLDDRHPELLDWGARHGLAPGVSSVAMVLGGRPLPGDRARCFAPLMRALG